MTELFQDDTILPRTVDDILSDAGGVGNGSSDGGTVVGGKYIGSALVGASYVSATNGARVEIFPEYDATIGFASYDANNVSVFKTIIAGADIGDVIIGDYAGGQGAKWDQSAGTFDVLGNIEANSIAAGVSISSPVISGGSITGTTLLISGATFGVRLNSTINQIELLYNSVVQGTVSGWAYAQGKAIAMFADTFDPGVSGTGFIIQEGTTSKITFYVEGVEAYAIP